MAISLAQAAEATGRDRSTILRSIKKGTISATRDQRTQAWMVEAVELFRIFPPMHAEAMPQPAQAAAEVHRPESDVLLARLEAAEARLADKDAVIDDLRRRLDTEAEERRRLTALLTDRTGPSAAQRGEEISGVTTGRMGTMFPSSPRRAWWPWRR